MKVKVHVELITDWGESRTVETCEFARPMTEFSAETVGRDAASVCSAASTMAGSRSKLSSSTSWKARRGS